MATNYWDRALTRRIGRRRAITATGATAFGAAFLAACGGDDDDDASPVATSSGSSSGGTTGASGSSGSSGGSGSSGTSSLAYIPTDTTAQAKRGGTYVTVINAEPAAFDVITGSAPDVPHPARVYSRIVKYQAYKYPDEVQPIAAPDAATSWETSPDGLKVTYKLRPDMKFDPRPPTNGRLVTSQDVLFSANRFMELSTQRSVLSNEKNPDAAITSFDAPDDNTFVVNLAFPYAPINMLIGAWRYIVIMPTEADGGFDVRNDMRGSGAWRLDNYQRGSHYKYVRNDDWYDADKVNLDGMDFVVIPEISAQIAQFRAGTLWNFYGSTATPQEEVLGLKKDFPQLIMPAQEEFSAGGTWIRFGMLPDSPFRDERVRQATSMALDRELFIRTFGNADAFEDAGLEVPIRWNSGIYAGESFWLDPKDESAYGDAAKFYQYNLDDAKALMKAAGIDGQLETTFHYPVGFFAGNFDQRMEVLHAMLQDSGLFKLTIDAVTNYNANFQGQYTNGEDKWQGIAAATTAARAEVDVLLHEYVKSGQPRSGHLDNGQPDAELDALVEKQRTETDTDARAAIVHDIQKRVASKMYYMMEPGQALGYNIAWPWMQNYGLWRSKSGGSVDQEGNIYYWYDASKA
jgi:peptide/nickel transport system substrate-binding protein